MSEALIFHLGNLDDFPTAMNFRNKAVLSCCKIFHAFYI